MTKFDFLGKKHTEETAIKKIKYTCVHCNFCLQRIGSNKDYYCELEKTTSNLGVTLKFDVKKEKPCKRFHPADYIEALSYDTR